MSWIYFAIFAQFIAAACFMVDKYLVTSKAIGRPAVYAIYVGLLSGVVIFMLPFGVIDLPAKSVLLIYAIMAVAYVTSLLFLYKSLQIADASDVVPVAGSITAIATLVFSLFLLNGLLPHFFYFGFPLLILGTSLMSRFRFDKKTTLFVILAGLLFGLTSVLIKMAFERTDFANAFFWSRIANVAGALIFMIWPANFRAVFNNFRTSTGETKLIVAGNKALAGLSYFFTLLAINWGDVSVVNSLTGFQFVFILMFAFILTYTLPKYFHEAVHREGNRLKKITASAIIVIGFIMMFWS